MKLDCTQVFKKDLLKLPDKARKAAFKQITQLLLDHTHPSLRIEGIAGPPRPRRGHPPTTPWAPNAIESLRDRSKKLQKP